MTTHMIRTPWITRTSKTPKTQRPFRAATAHIKSPAKSTTIKKIRLTVNYYMKTSESSKPPISFSRHVLIKEIENDEDSDLLSPATTKRMTAKLMSAGALAAIKIIEQIPKPIPVPTLATATTETAEPSPSPTPSPVPAATTPPSKSTSPPTTTSASSSPMINMTVPSTTLDFQRDWKSYSKNNELLYQYVKLIQPESLPGIFKSAFESDYLSSMLTVFKTYYIPSEAHLSFSALVAAGSVVVGTPDSFANIGRGDCSFVILFK
ncbi:hypothetical protein EC991_002815 [Linnemannia zychae]|nr:hypothetical protein EC991_002815 [Linnemannia zychae]